MRFFDGMTMGTAVGAMLFLMTIFIAFPVFKLDKIAVIQDYHNEYQQCANKVKNLEATQLKCPEVKCSFGVNGTIFYIMGILLWITGFIFVMLKTPLYGARDNTNKDRKR